MFKGINRYSSNCLGAYYKVQLSWYTELFHILTALLYTAYFIQLQTKYLVLILYKELLQQL